MTTLLDRKLFENPAIWTLVAADYTELLLPIFERYSLAASQLINLDSRARVLDVACGPGTLTVPLSLRVAHVDAVDFSTEMLDRLRARLGTEQASRVTLHAMDGHALDFEDGQFDAVFSMFGVVHFADPELGFREMIRVAKPGAPLIASTWASPRESTINGLAVAALRSVLDDLPSDEAIFHSTKTPSEWLELLTSLGLCDVRMESMVVEFELPSAAVFWANMSRASVPLVLLRDQVGSEHWAKLERAVLDYLERQVQWPRPVCAKGYFFVANKPQA
jgi:SAM-dependent methyltransferase